MASTLEYEKEKKWPGDGGLSATSFFFFLLIFQTTYISDRPCSLASPLLLQLKEFFEQNTMATSYLAPMRF
jgi:hypothetical protein